MAKKSAIARNVRRQQIVARYAERRRELKKIIQNPRTDPQVRADAVRELARQPRDASPTRIRNRDTVDGRPRAHLRKAGLSRIRFRELAHRGQLPGITKSSW